MDFDGYGAFTYLSRLRLVPEIQISIQHLVNNQVKTSIVISNKDSRAGNAKGPSYSNQSNALLYLQVYWEMMKNIAGNFVQRPIVFVCELINPNIYKFTGFDTILAFYERHVILMCKLKR